MGEFWSNTCQPPEPDLEWTTWPKVPFSDVVLASRLLVHCGANPIIAAASVQRAWFTQGLAVGQSIPGTPDTLVDDVRDAIASAREENRLVPHSN